MTSPTEVERLPHPESHLAVGTTGGQLVILSWTLPSKWGGAIQWAEPECRVVWAKGDGMAVRHITWQLDPPQVCLSPSLRC